MNTKNQCADLLRKNLRATGVPEYMLSVYSITTVSVIESDNHPSIELQNSDRNAKVINISTNVLTSDNMEIVDNLSENRPLIVSTSMLHHIDKNITNLESVVKSDIRNPNLNGNKVTDIHIKTYPPLNIEWERRMKELCWFAMYWDGKNGFVESRNVPITAFDNFQARVMSNKVRFQKVYYLFFALSVVEYFRAKAGVSVSCPMRHGQNQEVP